MQVKKIYVLSLLVVFLAAVSFFSGVISFDSTVTNGAATNVYYVSPTGNDSNPGTQEKPWKTLAKAGSTAQAGDTVILMDGEYVGQLAPKNSGTAALPITFKAQNRGKALIKGDPSLKSYGYGNSRLWGIYIEGKSYLNIDGINIEMQECAQLPFL